jgi:hypothetical protein
MFYPTTRKFTDEEIFQDAKKYKNRVEWTIYSPELYDEAIMLCSEDFFKNVTRHMKNLTYKKVRRLIEYS